MEIIRSLVQNLIVIIILAVLLDMFLPAGSMRNFVKMVMGLLIIIAVVQAVGNLINWDYNADLPALTSTVEQGQYPEILEAGKRLAEDQQQKALEEYKNSIANQVMALSRANKEISLLDVKVEIQGDQSKTGYGRIQEISLTVGPKNGSADQQSNGIVIKEVEPVSVGPDTAAPPPGQAGAEGYSRKEAVDDLVNTLANFYNLSTEQIKVNYQ